MTSVSSQRAQERLQDTEREPLTNHQQVEKLIERARRERAEFTVALLWRSVAWLKSLVLPVRMRIQDSEVIAVKHKQHP